MNMLNNNFSKCGPIENNNNNNNNKCFILDNLYIFIYVCIVIIGYTTYTCVKLLKLRKIYVDSKWV